MTYIPPETASAIADRLREEIQRVRTSNVTGGKRSKEDVAQHICDVAYDIAIEELKKEEES
jgi:hypothetical protein